MCRSVLISGATLGGSSFGRALGLPALAVEHNFFEMVVTRSAVALRTAFARDFGWAWGKKIAIGTPKNWANLSKSEMDGL